MAKNEIPIGHFDKKITIRKYTYVSGHGGDTATPSTHSQPWANMRFVSGLEDEKASQQVASKKVIWRILYDSEVTERMDVVWDSKVYDITYVAIIGISKFMDLETVLRDNK